MLPKKFYWISLLLEYIKVPPIANEPFTGWPFINTAASKTKRVISNFIFFSLLFFRYNMVLYYLMS
jgi:hypothetical protein